VPESHELSFLYSLIPSLKANSRPCSCI
jgi:hypothetical protein